MAVSTIKMDNHIPSWEYVGDVYWWSNSWTCPADGIAVAQVGYTSANADAYWYIRDASLSMNVANLTIRGANGTTASTAFPVIKGHTYSTSASAQIGTAHVYFYKFV